MTILRGLAMFSMVTAAGCGLLGGDDHQVAISGSVMMSAARSKAAAAPGGRTITHVMAVNPDYVDMAAATAEMPPFPEVGNVAAVHTAFFFSAPGSVHRATHSGTWGDAREATAEFGERYLQAVTRGTIRVLDDIERTFAAMPPR